MLAGLLPWVAGGEVGEVAGGGVIAGGRTSGGSEGWGVLWGCLAAFVGSWAFFIGGLGQWWGVMGSYS